MAQEFRLKIFLAQDYMIKSLIMIFLLSQRQIVPDWADLIGKDEVVQNGIGSERLISMGFHGHGCLDKPNLPG